MKNGVEADDSWSSSLLSVSANNNPDCAIGKDAVTIKLKSYLQCKILMSL